MPTMFIEHARELARSGAFEPPKQKPAGAAPTFYPYYAGFSKGFVRSVLASELGKDVGLVLDPWNGAGTTTAVAREAGMAAIGIDLNPVPVMVASARLANKSDAAHLYGLLHSAQEDSVVQEDEPLLAWLHPRTASQARFLVNSLLSSLAVNAHGQQLDPLSSPLPPLASLAVLSVAALVRQ